MADNIPVTAGVGTSVATDEIGGAHYQRVKVTFGVDGAAADVSASTPLPVAIQGALGSVSVSNFPVTQPISGTVGVSGSVAVTGTFWQATQPVSGTVGVSGSVAVTGPLTDTQLRATALPVSGTFWQATQPVSAASLPLPTDAATQTTLANIDTEIALIEGYFKAEDSAAVSGDKGLPLLAQRQLADTTTTDTDGDYTLIKIDEEGRVKVATKPASFAIVTGNITANAQTVFCDVSRASNVQIMMNTAALAGHNVTFEGSLDSTTGTDGVWFGIQVVRSNANTIELTSGALAATPAYAWEASVNGLTFVRVRATAHTSGTATWKFQRGSYATEPVPAAQISGTQPVSGTVTATVANATILPAAPATPYFLNSAATTNGALIITGTSGVASIYATNTGAAAAFLKLYNKATAPTVGTDVPEMIIPIPAAVSGVPGVANVPAGAIPLRFALGLGIAITGAVADTDTTAIAAGQVKVKLSRTV